MGQLEPLGSVRVPAQDSEDTELNSDLYLLWFRFLPLPLGFLLLIIFVEYCCPENFERAKSEEDYFTWNTFSSFTGNVY